MLPAVSRMAFGAFQRRAFSASARDVSEALPVQLAPRQLKLELPMASTG